MSISVKIRILLALLCATLMFTAVIVRQYYTPQDNLNQSAKILQDHLHQKEKLVYQLFSPSRFNQLKTINQHEKEALNLINDYTVGKRIWIITFLNGQINYWSGIKVLPRNAANYKDGVSFIKESNGYYEAIKKTEGNFSAVCLFPIRSEYRLHNLYLKNSIDRDLSKDNNLDIADFTDSHVQAIRSVNQSYLFSVKLKGTIENHLFLNFVVLLWAASLLVLCLLVHLLCVYYANKRKFLLATGILVAFIVGLRFINLYFHYPSVIYELSLFDPKFYHNGVLFPSLGDLCLNVLFICWLACFVYSYRYKLVRRSLSTAASYAIIIASIFVLAFIFTQLLDLFGNLVLSTTINFDVENILNLSGFSIIAVVMLCFCFLTIFLLTEAFLIVINRLNISQQHKVYTLLACVILSTIASALFHHIFTLLFILWGVAILIRGYAIVHENGRFDPFSFLSIMVLFALIASIKFMDFQIIKEKGLRKLLIQKLENSDDTTANLLFRSVEKRIINDPVLTDFFTAHRYNDDYLKTHLQSSYFDGYLAHYNLKIKEFDANGSSVSPGSQYALSDFKDMVMYSSIKVSDYFYRENEAFGFKSYFAILPVFQQDQLKGTIIFELKSKPLQFSYSFPQVLVNSELQPGNEFKGYSYAFYNNGALQSQNGQYIYNIVNNEFEGKLKQYTFKTTSGNSQEKHWFQKLARYNHLIYKPSQRKLIVVTREDNSFFESITTLTFFFIVLLSFGITVLALMWLWARIRVLSIRDNRLTWHFSIRFKHMLYKTRIQLVMIFAVVLTLLLVGAVTYYSIRSQYIEQQDNMMSEKVARVASAFETSQAEQLQRASEANKVMFNEFADNFSTDLVLFDRDGIPVLTTQPKIYEYGLLAKRINGMAYILLHKLQMSIVINNEKIGDLSYKAAYAPIRNSKNVTIGYLQIPYFSNEADYKERIGSLLNAMINIYALIFIAIGLLAVIIAQQITAPLSFIQHSLSRTVYGKKNEPIAWERDDEIGALVREYNKMITALEHSANRLAQSERESAWREMAKQVAHEIKNPLTPLKLGLQLLEKSWKDKDPKFDTKFERFSKSFVEQIESLSSIASEFSAFAKMPDTRMERLNVLETLGQAVTIFKHMENVKISYSHDDEKFVVMADRDQLLRCFNNLLKNAIEAMPQGQHGLIDITYTINTNSILLKIKDNGNGIPENLRERIFEPNFTTKSSGTGLGLAFVKNSIENAGGKVSFETETGIGTTFFLTFPKSRF